MSVLTRITLLTQCLVLIHHYSFSQSNLFTIKKEIPLKGIKKIEQTSFSDNYFIYHTKNDTGLWDHASKSFVFHHLREVKQLPYQANWIRYSTANEYGVYDITKGRKILKSETPFHVLFALDSSLVNVFNEKIIGLLDRTRNSAYYVNFETSPDTILLNEGPTRDKCWFDEKEKTLNYGLGNNDDWNYLDVRKLGFMKNFFTVLSSYGGTLFDRTTGKELLDFMGSVFELGNNIAVKSYSDNHIVFSYYDFSLNPIFQKVRADGFNTGHFKYFIDKNISSSTHVSDDVYLCKIDGKSQFVSASKMQTISGKYDNVFSAGYDFYNNGNTYFTLNNKSELGLFSSSQLEEFSPQFTLIEKRMFPDGSIWIRTDNELWASEKLSSDSIQKKKEATPELLKNSMILNHASINEGQLILSLAKKRADTHDASYQTITLFDEGSGVYDLKSSKWVMEPRFHSITPYKGFYVSMKVGSNYANSSWLQTSILDKNFKPITDKKFGASFIFNDMLFIRNDLSETYVEFDVTNNRTKRTLGALKTFDVDFRLIDGYLLIVDNNYDRNTKRITGMDIIDIISPSGQLIKVPTKRFRFLQWLGDELTLIGRIKDTEPTDVDIDHLKVDAYSIFDIRQNKLLTPWEKLIYYKDYDKIILIISKEGDEPSEIPLKEIRNKFKR